MLRLVTEPARDRALSRYAPSGHHVWRNRWDLGVLLRRRPVPFGRI